MNTVIRARMTTGKEKLIPFLAMAVLLVGVFSTLYVNARETENVDDLKAITINNIKLNIDELYEKMDTKTIQTDDGEKTGLPLDEVLKYSKVNCVSCSSYTIKANDPYQQTVTYPDIISGILTFDNEYYARVYFPNLAHSFWVYNLVEIEVNSL